METKKDKLTNTLKEVENIFKFNQNKKEWLSVAEMSKIIHISTSTIQTFKDRIPFKKYTKKDSRGCKIKNCIEAMKLLQCYKFKNFEYEQELLKNEKNNHH